MRHLAAPPNRISTFSCAALEAMLPTLRTVFNRYMVEEDGKWRVGKQQAKLQRIDTSIAEDRVAFERVRFMLKCEVTRWPYDARIALKKARGIQFTVNEASGYCVAQQYAAFSQALVEASSAEQVFNGVRFLLTYSSKMAHDDISQFVTRAEEERRKYPDSVIDERDGKNWDANVQVCHREALINVYQQLDRSLAAHARSGIRVRGGISIDDVTIRYVVNGTVKSGHPDTSSGNGALNREVTMQAITSLPDHLRPVAVWGLVMGDDYIAWLYFSHRVCRLELCAALNAAEAALGIVPERGLFEDIRHASFISLTFYRGVRGGVIALPKIGRLLSGLFWTVTPLMNRDPTRLASGIAAAFYPLYNTCDFMRKFLRHHMRVPPLEMTEYLPFYQWAEVGLRRLPEPINWREEHLIKYGADVTLLDFDLPDDYAGLAQHPVIDAIIAQDLSDPCDRAGCVSRHVKVSK